MQELKNNLQILLSITLINAFVLWNFISKGDTIHGIGYVLFFYVAILVIHVFTNRIPPKHEIEIKKPKQELRIAILFAALGILFLTLNFMLRNELLPGNPFIKIPVLLGSLVFAMPLGLFVYLLLQKYKIMNLGLATKPAISLMLGPLIWGLTGAFAYVFNPKGMLWEHGMEELGGFGGLLLQGLIGAALFEEFSRFVVQTRFGSVFKSNGFDILFATSIWAFMHFPVTYFKAENLPGTFMYCIQIIPLGFIWGYLTQRTKSIVPSTLAHGFNLWGFQNG